MTQSGWMRAGGAIGFVMLAALVACERQAPSAASSASSGQTGGAEVIALGIPGATNRGASIAARGAEVVVTWAATAGETTNVYAATSHDGGRTFGAPVRVNEIDGDARVTGEQPPRVSIGSTIGVVWESKRRDASVVLLSTSGDGGRTFSAATLVNAADVNNPRGWASLAMTSSGQPYVAWLDARTATAAPGAAHVHAAHGGEHTSMQQSVFFATAPGADARVAAGACFCCKTSVAAADDGSVYVAWRHVYPVNLRDMAVARSADGGRTFGDPVRVSEDHWQIDACPEDGPAIATGTSGVVHIAWPTFLGETRKKAVFYSYSTDGGRSFAPRIRVDADEAATAAHPQIAVNGSQVTVVWDETRDTATRVRARTFTSAPDGRSWAPERTAPYLSAEKMVAEYPSVAFSDGRTITTWTEIDAAGASTIRVAGR